MAQLIITLETNQESFPTTWLEQTREQLRDCLVIIVSNLVNRGLTNGDVTAIPGVRATYTYTAKQKKAAAPAA